MSYGDRLKATQVHNRNAASRAARAELEAAKLRLHRLEQAAHNAIAALESRQIARDADNVREALAALRAGLRESSNGN